MTIQPLFLKHLSEKMILCLNNQKSLLPFSLNLFYHGCMRSL